MTDPTFLRAIRASYDTVATDYANEFAAELAGKPLDRALLSVFAELVLAGGGGRVADIGCGPGHVTAHLAGLGLDPFGIDLSPEMVTVARNAYPDLRFDVGSMTSLDLGDGTLDGLVAYYSIIHIPPDRLPGVFAEFHRVLAPGGEAFLAFQVRDDAGHLTEWFGHTVSLHGYPRQPEGIADLLRDAGLRTHARLVREPDDSGEKAPRAYLLARKPR